MRVSILKDRKFISTSFYKIDYDRILSLLNLIRIERISIFIDKGNKYCYSNSISTNEFIECVTKLNQSLLIFDGLVDECFADKEIKTLSNRKILIEIDLGENQVSILINKNNADVQIEDIKKI